MDGSFMDGWTDGVSEKLDGQSRLEDKVKISAVEKERLNSLKLVNNRALRGREWLIPLVVVSGIVLFIFLAYNKLR